MAETNAFRLCLCGHSAKTSISTDRVQQRFFCSICDHQFKNSPEGLAPQLYVSMNRYTGVQ